jgi:hypothetical protein
VKQRDSKAKQRQSNAKAKRSKSESERESERKIISLINGLAKSIKQHKSKAKTITKLRKSTLWQNKINN